MPGDPGDVSPARPIVEPPPIDRRELRGPFDIVGDVHGCFDERRALLRELGYEVAGPTEPGTRYGYQVVAPAGRTLVFVGDLVDCGPRVVDVPRLAIDAVLDSPALGVRGNHDDKLRPKLRGCDVRVADGLAESLEQIGQEPPAFAASVADFVETLPLYQIFDDGRLVVAQAGLTEELHGVESERVRSFVRYGDTTGEKDEFGRPVRRNRAVNDRGAATVVYGHAPVARPE